MVRKEIWTCLLAYNLIRKAMLEAAYESGLSPHIELCHGQADDHGLAGNTGLCGWPTGNETHRRPVGKPFRANRR